MALSTTKKQAQFVICPYLRQLDADWLSMDADGFYCHAGAGRTKVFQNAEEVIRCAVAGFASCSEYQRLQEAPKAT